MLSFFVQEGQGSSTLSFLIVTCRVHFLAWTGVFLSWLPEDRGWCILKSCCPSGSRRSETGEVHDSKKRHHRNSCPAQSLARQRHSRQWETDDSHYSRSWSFLKPRWMLTEGMLRHRTRFVSCKPLVPTFSPVSQYLTLFSACFCLKTSYLIKTLDSLKSNWQPIAPDLTPERGWSHMGGRAPDRPSTRPLSSRTPGGPFQQKNDQRRAAKCKTKENQAKYTHKKTKNRTQKQASRRTLSSVRAETKRWNVALPHLRWGWARWLIKLFVALCESFNDHGTPAGTDFVFTNEFLAKRWICEDGFCKS